MGVVQDADFALLSACKTNDRDIVCSIDKTDTDYLVSSVA